MPSKAFPSIDRNLWSLLYTVLDGWRNFKVRRYASSPDGSAFENRRRLRGAGYTMLYRRRNFNIFRYAAPARHPALVYRRWLLCPCCALKGVDIFPRHIWIGYGRPRPRPIILTAFPVCAYRTTTHSSTPKRRGPHVAAHARRRQPWAKGRGRVCLLFLAHDAKTSFYACAS